jgi:hypothetical protein
MVRKYAPLIAPQRFLLSYSLDELVKDGKNGLIFQNATQLAEQLEVGLLILSLV